MTLQTWKGANRDPRGAIRLPSADIKLGIHPIPRRWNYLLPPYRGLTPAWRDVVRADPCSWCGRLPDPEDATVEHVTPRADGGRDAWENLAGACRWCNQERGTLSLLDYLAKRAFLDRLAGRGHVRLTTLWDIMRSGGDLRRAGRMRRRRR